MSNQTGYSKSSAAKWLRAHGFNKNGCPSCGHKEFAVGETLVMIPVFTPVISPSGMTPSLAACHVMCEQCGHTQFFNAMKMLNQPGNSVEHGGAPSAE